MRNSVIIISLSASSFATKETTPFFFMTSSGKRILISETFRIVCFKEKSSSSSFSNSSFFWSRNTFVSHYYTRDFLYQHLRAIFPSTEYAIEIESDNGRNYVAFVYRPARQQTGLITMINNVLGNIPLELQIPTLKSIKNTFY